VCIVIVGELVNAKDGAFDSTIAGSTDNSEDGTKDCNKVGDIDGDLEGISESRIVGLFVGTDDKIGVAVGDAIGSDCAPAMSSFLIF